MLEVGLFIAALFSVVVIKLLTGSINTRHLLHSKDASGTGEFSPARAQALVLTIGAAIVYLLETFEAAPRRDLPDVPTEILALVGTSQVIYLGGKAYSRIAWQRLRNSLIGGLR